MNCFECRGSLTEDSKTASLESERIDSVLRKDKTDTRNEIKLLLLGTGGSGKSTFVKQVRILNGQGFTKQERVFYKKLIHKNLIDSMEIMINKMDTFKNINYEDSLSEEFAEIIIEKAEVFTDDPVLNPGHFDALECLWADRGIQKVHARRKLYHLSDSTKYLFDNIERIKNLDYIPSEQDVLHVRSQTLGIIDYPLVIKGRKFRIIDVGGQKSERRKWIHCFENITAIIFFAALSEYDTEYPESEYTSGMEESRAVFQNILSLQWFQNTSIILFLNKNDIFEHKIRYSSLKEHYSDYVGPSKDHIAARNFILTIYTSLNENSKRIIYSHFTVATDTDNMRVVFDAVKEIIFNQLLKSFSVV